MTRVTLGTLRAKAIRISESLRGIDVVISCRHGMTAVDLYDSRGMVDALCIGTKRECSDFLRGMETALFLEITNRIAD